MKNFKYKLISKMIVFNENYENCLKYNTKFEELVKDFITSDNMYIYLYLKNNILKMSTKFIYYSYYEKF